MRKKPIDLLRIVKNKKATNKDGDFVYVFEWSYQGEVSIQEKEILTADIYNRPIEHYNVQEMIDHKKHCCVEIKPGFKIETVEL